MNPTQPYSPPGGPPQGPIPIQPGTAGSGGGDNQWMIFLAIGCASLCLFCLCAAGVGGVFYAVSENGGGGLGLGADDDTVLVRATITSFVGSVPGVGTGTTCELPITAETLTDGSQQCHVVVTCGVVVLYGDASSGFFPCQFSTSPPSVMGQDTDTSMSDRDGAFFVSTMGGNVSIMDDFNGHHGLFTLTATISSTE